VAQAVPVRVWPPALFFNFLFLIYDIIKDKFYYRKHTMKHKINWYTTPFFILTPIIGVIGTAYVVLTKGLQMATLALTIGYMLLA
jgi:hypothetical protein